MSVPEIPTASNLVTACLSRLKMVAASPGMFHTFLREELGLEWRVDKVSNEAAANLAVDIIHHFVEDEFFRDDLLSLEQIAALIRELQQDHGIPDTGLTVADLDQKSEDYEFDYIYSLLNDIAEAILIQDAAEWFEQGGREQLMETLKQCRMDASERLRLQE